jgi:hypothetical protein
MFSWVVVVMVITWKVMEQSRSSNGRWGTWLGDNNTNNNNIKTTPSMQENDLIFFDLIDNHLITYLEDDLIVIHNRKPKK